MTSWEVGAKVLARWSGDNHFYAGVVASKAGDDAYEVHFDDGEKETVSGKDVRAAQDGSDDEGSKDGSATDESYKKSLQKFAVRRSTRARRTVKTYLEENSEVQPGGSSGESDASEGSEDSGSSGSDDDYSDGGKRRRKRKRPESPVLVKQRWNPSRRVKADKPTTLYESSEEDSAFEDNVELAEKEKSRVEAILAHRLKEEGSDEVEYLVKLRDMSYLHVEWIAKDEVVNDVNGATRLKKFRNENEEPELETRRSRVDYFDQTFVEVERIVDATPELRARLLKTWQNQASKILSKLTHARKKGVKVAAFFLEAVDEEKDNAPGYFNIVKQPMDLGTVRSKLQESRYSSFDAFASDVKLVFTNCQLYNEDSDTWIRECCDHLQEMFQRLEEKYIESKAAEGAVASDSDEEFEYFVKWRGLSYADCSWEKESDIHAEEAIADFQKRLSREKFPSKSSKGSKSAFKKYNESRAYKNDLKLRSYQVEGLNWLAFNYTQNRGCILADEMGLGKTVQVISFIEHLFRVEEVRKPALVVAPLSTLHHWRNECESWTDLNCILYHDLGNKEMNGSQAREFIRDHEFFLPKSSKSKKRQAKFDLLITSYEVLVADAGLLSAIPFSVVVTDEGQRLKSKTSKLVTTFESYIQSDMRVVLSGTPLQNNISELWALLNFVEPGAFPSEEEFVERYGNLRNATQVAQLQKKLKPYMLRRLKETVEKDIPLKEETVIDVELTIMQKKYYRAVFERNRDFLRTGDNVSPQLISIEMELRKCCNHPFLLKGVENKELAGLPFHTDAGLEQFIHASGKLVFLDKLLAKLRSEKRKVLIFSQFKIMLDLIEDYCKHASRRYPVERIDGNVAGDMRQRAIDRFSNPNENCFVFLLSTRAGGVGINLVAADTVVLFDSDWNPQNDLQAMARCHRIGQKKNVMVYRLVTRQTYESSLFERAARKLGLEQAVLGSRDGVQASAKEVETLLRHGAYQLMEDDEASLERIKEYCESNIDDLLNRSNKIVWNKSKADSAGGINFSKASFVAKQTGQEIEISDPKFWTKLLGEDARTTLLVRLNDGSAYASEAKRFAFFDELRKGGNAIMAEKLTGNPRPDYEDIITNALVQITTMTEVFTEPERAAAAEFLKLIQRPSRRNKATHRFYATEKLMVCFNLSFRSCCFKCLGFIGR